MKKWKQLLSIGIIAALGAGLTACGSNPATADASTGESVDTAAETDASVTETDAVQTAAKEEASVDPITGEAYPETFYIGSLNGSPQTGIILEEGWLDEIEALGVKTEILYFESGRDVTNAYASDSIAVASFGSSPISLGISNDVGYEVIFINDTLGSIESLVAKDGSGISTVADLAGKKVATPFASTSHYSLLNAIQLAGLSDSDVELLDMQPQDILAAWTRGDIDAAYVWTPVLTELLKDGTVVIDSGELAKQGVVTADLSTADIDFAAKYPTLVTAYVDAFIKVNDLILNDYERAVSDVAKALNITEAEADEQLAGADWVSGEGQLAAEYLGTSGAVGALADTLKSTADFHVTQGNLNEAPELAVFQNAVDPSFVERAVGK